MTDEDRPRGSGSRITVGDTKQNGCQKNAHVCERKSPETRRGTVISSYASNSYFWVFVQLLTIVGSNFPLEIVSKSVECE